MTKQQPKRPDRRAVIAGAALVPAALAAPAALRAQTSRVWRMVTSWPKSAPGPGTSADRIAARITALSRGRTTVEVFGAGELVPALEVFDAVAAGDAQMAHTAAFFWAGKVPAAPFFTAVPFGLTPLAHDAWLTWGGGQALWDGLYADHGLKPFAAGNSGMQMGGWYRRPIGGLDDFRGLKIRMPGLGGAVVGRLGATAVSIPPGDILTALTTGVIDAAEFLGPWSDTGLGLSEAASHYYWPGFHEPNGSAELLVNRALFDALPAEDRTLIETVAQAEAQAGLAQANWENAQALARLRRAGRVAVRQYPEPVITAARAAPREVMDGQAEADGGFKAVLSSYRQAQAGLEGWFAVAPAVV